MNESIVKTIGVAFAVCLICSLVVSASAVSLRDLQKENKLNENNKLNPTRGRNNKMRGLLDLNNLTIDKV